MVSDERYVMCDSGVGRMWLISWWVAGNLRESDWLEDVCKTVSAREWLDEF